jgi:hypothetical protein
LLLILAEGRSALLPEFALGFLEDLDALLDFLADCFPLLDLFLEKSEEFVPGI